MKILETKCSQLKLNYWWASAEVANDYKNDIGIFELEMLGELDTPVRLSVWDKILLIKSKRTHALRDKI